MWLWIIAVLVALITVFALSRDWLRAQPWAGGFFKAIEPVEIWLYNKSQTIFVSRLLSLGGVLVTLYDAVAVFAVGLDWTPVTSRLLASVPPDTRPLVVSGSMAALGFAIEWLRRKTKTPLSIVQLPDAVAATIPEVIVAEVTKEEAVAAVAEAKKEGTV